eukprot:8324175-Pyramimonas_sp.AAC.1
MQGPSTGELRPRTHASETAATLAAAQGRHAHHAAIKPRHEAANHCSSWRSGQEQRRRPSNWNGGGEVGRGQGANEGGSKAWKASKVRERLACKKRSRGNCASNPSTMRPKP